MTFPAFQRCFLAMECLHRHDFVIFATKGLLFNLNKDRELFLPFRGVFKGNGRVSSSAWFCHLCSQGLLFYFNKDRERAPQLAFRLAHHCVVRIEIVLLWLVSDRWSIGGAPNVVECKKWDSNFSKSPPTCILAGALWVNIASSLNIHMRVTAYLVNPSGSFVDC
jgi:hypothetical protein